MVSVVAAVIAALHVSSGRAATPDAVQWRAPESCPRQADVAAALGDHGTRVREVIGSVEPDGDELRLRYSFTLDGEPHAGELRARRCGSLVDALAAVVTVAIGDAEHAIDVPEAPTGPNDGSASDEPAPSPEPARDDAVHAIATAPPAPSRAEPDMPTSVGRTRRVARLHGFASITGVAAHGILPAWSGTLAAALGIAGRHWSAGIETSFELPRELAFPGNRDARARLWVAAAGPRGCGIVGIAAIEAQLCVSALFGAVRGRGRGDDIVGRANRSFFAAIAPGAMARVRLSQRVGLLVGADLLVPVARAHFGVAGVGSVCCAPVGTRLRAGLEVTFP